MRIVTPVLVVCLAALAAGFTIRNIYYANSTSEDISEQVPRMAGSIIQVKSSDNKIHKSKTAHKNMFPRNSIYLQYGDAITPTVTHSSQLINTRRTRELRSGQELTNLLQELILRGSLLEKQRQERTIIQAPLFQGKICPPGQRLDRGRKKCRGPW